MLSSSAATATPSALSPLLKRAQQSQLGIVLLGPALAGRLHLLQAVLNGREVRQGQFKVDYLDVCARIQSVGRVWDIFRSEAAHDHGDRIHATYVSQELVSQPFSLAGALHQAGNVHEPDGGRRYLLRPNQGSELIQPVIGHGHDADVRLYGGEGVRRYRSPRASEGIEQCRLAHVGQADTTDLQAHRFLRPLPEAARS